VIATQEYFWMKERTIAGFGDRLAKYRKAKGLTQTELGGKVGLSQRMVAYYEQDSAQPPGALLIDLAKTLEVSIDVLLGITSPQEPLMDAKTAKLFRRLQRIQELPPTDRKAVLKYLDALLAQREATQS